MSLPNLSKIRIEFGEDFPDGPVVKAGAGVGWVGSVTGWGAKILFAFLLPGKRNICLFIFPKGFVECHAV